MPQQYRLQRCYRNSEGGGRLRVLWAIVLFAVVSLYSLRDDTALIVSTTTTTSSRITKNVVERQFASTATGTTDVTQEVDALDDELIDTDVSNNDPYSLRWGTVNASSDQEDTLEEDIGAPEVATPASFDVTSSLDETNIEANRLAYPRWGKNDIISVPDLLDFIISSSVYATMPRDRPKSLYRPTMDHPTETTVNYWFPETVYVVTGNGTLYGSGLHRSLLDQESLLRDKVLPTERAMQRAVQRLLSTGHASGAPERWPLLYDLLHNTNQGFVFLAWYGDYTGCNQENWFNQYSNSTASIPLFTPAVRVDCDYAIPFPNYQTIRDAEAIAEEEEASQIITRSALEEEDAVDDASDTSNAQRRPQVVWRGSLTGAERMDPNVTSYRTPRWQLVQQYGSQTSNHSLWDIRPTRLPARQAAMVDRVAPELHGPLAPFLPSNHTNDYVAVLDIDGNSWSSRFGKLLCGDSVVVKIDPTYVEYWYPTVQAGTHYLSATLKNLEDVVANVIHSSTTTSTTTAIMVQNAKAWCRAHLRPERVEEDMLDIWERYVELSGGVEAWSGITDRVMAGPLLQMKPVG